MAVNLKYTADQRNQLAEQYNAAKNQLDSHKQSKVDKDKEYAAFQADQKKNLDNYNKEFTARTKQFNTEWDAKIKGFNTDTTAQLNQKNKERDNELKQRQADINKIKDKTEKANAQKDLNVWLKDRNTEIANWQKDRAKEQTDLATQRKNDTTALNNDKANWMKDYNANLASQKTQYDAFNKDYTTKLADYTKQFNAVNSGYTASQKEYATISDQAKKLGMDPSDYENQIQGQMTQAKKDADLAAVAKSTGMSVDQLKQMQVQKANQQTQEEALAKAQQLREQQQAETDKARLDFELVRLLKCGEALKSGISFHPDSPYAKICADIVVRYPKVEDVVNGSNKPN